MAKFNPLIEWRTRTLVITAGSGLFTTLPNENCDEITFVNPTAGVSLDIIDTSVSLVKDTSQFITIDAPSGLTIQVAANASELAVRRNDQAATATNVRYIKRSYLR